MTETEKLKQLARGIILAQGNIFIKELLRDNGIRIGATKADFEKNLLTAIEDGRLTREHFDKWLTEVEGWGDQHVYLYEIPEDIRKSSVWKQKENVKKRITEAGLVKMWEASLSHAFPDEPQLTGIYYDNNTLSLVWHDGDFIWTRDKNRDKPNVKIGLDEYEFRAYLKRAKRTVTRFEWPVNHNYAGLFVQLPWDKDKHGEAKHQVFQVLKKIANADAIKEMPIYQAIKNIDQLTIHAPDDAIASQSAKLQALGASIDFVSDVSDQSYSRVAAVRNVRGAVQPGEFRGEHGIFIFKTTDRMNISRKIRIELHGRQKRIRFWHSCLRNDVWTILNVIKGHNS